MGEKGTSLMAVSMAPDFEAESPHSPLLEKRSSLDTIRKTDTHTRKIPKLPLEQVMADITREEKRRSLELPTPTRTPSFKDFEEAIRKRHGGDQDGFLDPEDR